jgi:trehalose-phosphatase
MRALHDQPTLADFFSQLRTASKRALMLDYDGTLAPFQVRTDQAIPYTGVREIINAIMESGHTRVVIITGRWTRDLNPLLGLKYSPEIWGSHGWEQLKPNGEYVIARMNENALRHLVEADAWTADIEAQGGRCEMKPGGLAIHWRGLEPEKADEIRNIVFQNWRIQEMHNNLVWHDFDGGIELRVPGRHKGFVVETILSEMGHVSAAYLGDDATDEDAFKAIQGKGISVLVRPQFRPTSADIWLQPPQELLDFLRQWQYASGGTR